MSTLQDKTGALDAAVAAWFGITTVAKMENILRARMDAAVHAYLQASAHLRPEPSAEQLLNLLEFIDEIGGAPPGATPEQRARIERAAAASRAAAAVPAALPSAHANPSDATRATLPLSSTRKEPMITTPINAPHIGDDVEGGTYVGAIRIGEHIFGIVVAPKAEGETVGAWLESEASVPGAESFFDGIANTCALAAAGSTLAHWAQGLRIAGHDDWYLPSRDELELVYRNLKPTEEANWQFRGDNPSSVPVGYAYRPGAPAQTAVERFREGGAEAMEPRWYWSSTQTSADYAWDQNFYDGGQDGSGKSVQGRARAVRRFLIN